MTSTATGSTSCFQSKPPIMLLVPGSQPSPNTKIAARSGALANSGIEVVVMLVTEMVRSRYEPSFMPDRMPSTRASGMMNAIAQNARTAVFHSRSHMKSLIGFLNRTDSPRSPVTKPHSQRP